MHGLIDSLNLGADQHSRRRGLVVGVSLSVLIGLLIYPFRHNDYELEFLLVLPVVYAGVLGGRHAAVVTAFVSVMVFILVTRDQANQIEEDIIAFIMFLGSGLVIGAAVGSGSDRLTLAKQREEERRRLQELDAQVAESASRLAVLEQVDHQRVALLRSVSHDLRTPLATIRAVVTDLHDGNYHDEATRLELLESVAGEAERLDRLVGNLLSLSRIEAGSLHVEDQSVDTAELLQLAVLRLTPLFPRVQLEVEIDPSVPLIRGDPLLLDQVVSNLLENASRYAPPGTTVTVGLASSGPNLVLRVCDQGPGIRAEHVDEVFQAFWRGPDSPSSGLGLTIVRAIVEAHGGSIRVVETPGGGATFEVRLPAREGAPL